MEELKDVLYHVFHVSIIIVNTTFWISFRTLRIAQITLLLTLVSWMVFGYFYGFGYCILTDWHWQVKQQLGEKHLPPSYIKLVLDRMTGMDFDSSSIDTVTIIILILSVIGCLVQSIRFRARSLTGPMSLFILLVNLPVYAQENELWQRADLEIWNKLVKQVDSNLFRHDFEYQARLDDIYSASAINVFRIDNRTKNQNPFSLGICYFYNPSDTAFVPILTFILVTATGSFLPTN